MTFGSLFAGIGGLDLGLERAGMQCRWQVEIDEYCQRVLRKHWPDVGQWDDIRAFPPAPAEDWRVDLICGGFPCQDISYAGRGAGLEGERSGLFFQAIRVVRELRPRFVLLENVAALLSRGLDRVLGELAAIGFDAEWHCIQAADVGAPHIRDRLFVLAHANGFRCPGARDGRYQPRRADVVRASQDLSGWYAGNGRRTKGACCLVAAGYSCWSVEPDVGRVANGVPSRVDRLRGLGNAVVPQVAEWIGRQIMAADRSYSDGR